MIVAKKPPLVFLKLRENFMPDNPNEIKKPQRKFSIALPVTIAILLCCAWYAYFSGPNYDSEGAKRSHMYYAPAITLAKAELAFRAVAVRRYAARIGHLPQSLADCETDMPDILKWLQWIDDHEEIEFELHIYRSVQMMDLPWVPEVPAEWNRPRTELAPRPSANQDFLGLPIQYVKAMKLANDDSWIDSSDPLGMEIEKYLEENGGVPPAASQPFSLASLFVRDRTEYLAERDRVVVWGRLYLFGGLASILGITGIVLRKWNGPKLSFRGIVAMLFGGVVAFTFFAPRFATCYVMSPFRSRRFSQEQRLTILNEAVRQGEIPTDIAETARAYIQKYSKE
jgi:hypothetical protein